MGHLEQARDAFTEALEASDGEVHSGRSAVLLQLVEVNLLLGCSDQADDRIEEARTIGRAVGRTDTEVHALMQLSANRLACDEARAALGYAEQALALVDDNADRHLRSMAHRAAGTAHAAVGDHLAALGQHAAALALADEVQSRVPLIEARIGLARAEHRLGRTSARSSAEAALATARRWGYRILAGQALAALVEICAAAADHDAVLAYHPELALIVAETRLVASWA